MDRKASFREEQLKIAMQMQEMGIDPDKIMVTYTPEEFHEMHSGPDDPTFELTKETVDFFPVSLLGVSAVLRCYDLSVNAFSNPYNENIIELYNKAVRKALMSADECEYTEEQLATQINIQDTLAKAIQAAIDYYTEEYESDEKAYESAVNSIQKSELSSDMRHSKFVLDRVVLTKDGNDSLVRLLYDLLCDIRKR